jgi:hypothetical protein
MTFRDGTQATRTQSEIVNRSKILKSCIPPMFLLVVGLALGCERPTRVTVEGGNPPRFLLSGSGSLSWLRFRSPHKQRDAEGEDASLYWAIKANKGSARVLEELSPLTYGVVPTGYVQVYPEKGQAPALIEGDRYFVRFLTVNAPGVDGYLTVRDGKASFTPYP